MTKHRTPSLRAIRARAAELDAALKREYPALHAAAKAANPGYRVEEHMSDALRACIIDDLRAKAKRGAAA